VAGSPGEGARAGVVGAVDIAGVVGEVGVVGAVVMPARWAAVAAAGRAEAALPGLSPRCRCAASGGPL